MKFLKVLVSALLLSMAGGPHAQATPLITGVSGSITAGSTVTIAGSGFGLKPSGPPIKFDNFEGGSLGSQVANGWTADGASNCGAPIHRPIYSNTILRTNSTKSVQCRFDEASDPGCAGDGAHYSSSFGVSSVPNPGLPEIFMDGWVYYNPPATESRNVKLIRVHTAFNSTPNLFVNIYCAANSDGMRVDQAVGTSAKVYDNCDQFACPHLEPWHGESWWEGNWRHIQLYLKQSGIGLNDGTVKMWTDGVLDPSATNWNNRAANTYWDTVFFGNYVGHDGDGSQAICPSSSTGNTFIYWDDAYVDNTLAHIEIGNAPTYAACTHREIQIPVTWATGSIVATINIGSFSPTDKIYLYVVDASGLVNVNGFVLGAVDVIPDVAQSYFVPQAGAVGASALEGPAAIAYAVTCPNNDLLTNNSRLKVVLKNAAGTALAGISAADVYVKLNGGTPIQGFSGTGDDSIIANLQYNPLAHCPDLRFIYADSATDASGTTYITWGGATPGQRGTLKRDPTRKWGAWAGSLPVYASGILLQGRITSTSANGTYTAHVRNLDVVGGERRLLNQGEIVNTADLNAVQYRVGQSSSIGQTYYRMDFDNNGFVGANDYQLVRRHYGHRCNYPNPN